MCQVSFTNFELKPISSLALTRAPTLAQNSKEPLVRIFRARARTRLRLSLVEEARHRRPEKSSKFIAWGRDKTHSSFPSLGPTQNKRRIFLTVIFFREMKVPLALF